MSNNEVQGYSWTARLNNRVKHHKQENGEIRTFINDKGKAREFLPQYRAETSSIPGDALPSEHASVTAPWWSFGAGVLGKKQRRDRPF